MPGQLRQNTAVTITIGQFINWADSKTPLYLALGSNDNFDPTKLTCTLTKGFSQSVLTLTKTGGNNNVNLLADSQVSFELTTGNVDTCGRLVLSFNNAVEGSEVILEGKIFEFEVLSANAYDSLYGTGNPQVDIVKVNGTGITSVNDFKTDVSGILTAISALNNLSSSQIASLLTGLATGAEISALNNLSSSQVASLLTGLATAAQITALNNLSESQVSSLLANTATSSEITTILNAISALHNLSTSDLATSLSGIATATGIQSILTAISALNNLSSSQITAALSGVATTIEIQAVLTAIAALNNLSEAQITAALTDLATSTEAQNILTAITEIDAGTSAVDIVNTLLARTGFTVGGTLTFANLLKNLAAFIEGTYRLKAGTPNIWQISDADDKDTPVLEVELNETENPYKETTRCP